MAVQPACLACRAHPCTRARIHSLARLFTLFAGRDAVPPWGIGDKNPVLAAMRRTFQASWQSLQREAREATREYDEVRNSQGSFEVLE